MTHASSILAAGAPWTLCESPSWLPLRLIAPRLGLKPTQPQKPAGRRVERSLAVPEPAAIMPLPVAAAEPEDEPPGVRRVSQGLRVGPGGAVANSVVTV